MTAVDTQPARALATVAGEGASVLALGLHDCDDAQWAVLAAAGIRLIRVEELSAAMLALSEERPEVVITSAGHADALIAAVRGRRETASVHVVVCAALDSPAELRDALDVGADDVMRVPFAPQVLAARVAAGLRAARLRENEALLRSLVANIPGAVYRCACDADWTMQWLSDEIEVISGYPASDFIASAVRTFTSVIEPDDREQVERSVMEAVEAGRPYTLEYRIRRRDGDVRWVLERGQAQDAGDGRRWLDGAIFDITARRAAEQALREREIVEAALAEVRASRARILEAADRARQEIERNLHDGAQQRFVSVALRLQVWLAGHRDLSCRPGRARRRARRVACGARGVARPRARPPSRGVERPRARPGAVEPGHPGDRAGRAPVSTCRTTGCRCRSRPPRTTPSAKRSRTSPSTPVRRARGYGSTPRRRPRGGGGRRRRGRRRARFRSGLQGLRDRIAAVNGTLRIESEPAAGTVLRARLPV